MMFLKEWCEFICCNRVLVIIVTIRLFATILDNVN